MHTLKVKSIKQRTLSCSISYVGIALHSGHTVSMVVKPAEENTGINFVRRDVSVADNLIPAHWKNVVDTTLSTVLANEDGVRVGTVDQSVCRKALWVHRPVEVRQGDKYAILMPSNTPRVTVEIDFEESVVGSQTHSVSLVNEAFRNDIARARTFEFASDIKQLRTQGLARCGSMRNAILIDGDRIINEEGLRYQNEFVRHKILDVIGDLALTGIQLIGHFYAHKPGHKLNHMLIKQLLTVPEAWSYSTIDDINAVIGEQENKVSSVDNVRVVAPHAR